ncbi:extracellular solute-binding protein [Salipaludibacillus sp. HK11]|uniref:extracellular solute-binding protein n=1 Tax=Salipaludibacillus sp. HK11 TaxID=3394320 RepID=UPI0039FC65BC
MASKMKVTFIIGFLSLMLMACGGNPQTTDDGRMQLTYWVLFGGGDIDFMQSIVDEYNESQDEVYVNMVLQDFEDYYTKLVTSVVADRGPDVAVIHGAVLPEMVNQGLTTPLDSLAATTGLDWNQYNDNILDAMDIEDEYHGLPVDTHPHIMYLNTDLAEEAGMVDDDGNLLMDSDSPEDFVELFSRAKETLPEVAPLSLPTGGGDVFNFWWALYHQMGGTPIFSGDDLIDVDVTIDKDVAVEAAEYIKGFFYEEELVPLHIADFYQEFQSGNAVGIITGVWATGIWEDTEDMNFRAYPIPTLYEQEAAAGDSHTLIIPDNEDSTDERREATMEFMEFVTDEGGVTWAGAGHIPANDEVVESDEFKELPHRSDYTEVADQVVYPPESIYFNPAETEMVRSIDEIMADRVTPEEGIDQMVDELEILIN